MNNYDELVSEITKKILERIETSDETGTNGIFESMEDAIEACWKAQKEYKKLSLEDRTRIIDAIRNVALENAEMLSVKTVEETKMGNVEDKIAKNKLAATKTPGVEDLKSEAMAGDNGLTLLELSPFGVIGSITPTTNPTETVICNSIGMLAAGNGIVFSPHPTAKNVSLKLINMINEAITKAGAPPNIITTVSEPSIKQTNVMMQHPKVNMLVATGGPGIVKTVLSSGKKAIGAGAGNPPALVDETADIEKAARDIIAGAAFDNNLPCIAEKEIVAVDQIADYLIFSLKGSGAYFVEDKELLKKLEDLIIVDGSVNKGFIGKSAAFILDKLGVSYDPATKIISMDVEESHPFVQHELMMPIVPLVRAKNIEDAIEISVRCEHGFRHTAIMHSKNIDNLSAFAKEIQTTIFVKNGPSYCGIGVGGEGYTTFTIAGPTGEGLTSAKSFTRKRRCVLVDGFNIK